MRFYSVLTLGACVKTLVFVELLTLRVIVGDVCSLGLVFLIGYTFFSFQCTSDKECKQNRFVELPLGLCHFGKATANHRQLCFPRVSHTWLL